MDMRELLELQTGQVAFISGLLSGFSLSVAATVLRIDHRNRAAKVVFVFYMLSSLLFLVALYVDVRLSIELAGMESVPDSIIEKITNVRTLGTSCATVALVIFVLATSLLGWVATTTTGIITTTIGAGVFYCLWYVWTSVNGISSMLGNL